MRGLVLETLRFGLVGLINTAIGLSTIDGLMYFAKFSPVAANAIGYAIGIAVSFTLNRLWTFKSDKTARESLPVYCGLCVICYLLNLGVVMATTHGMAINPYIAQFFGIAVYSICLFAGCRWLVFAQRSDA